MGSGPGNGRDAQHDHSSHNQVDGPVHGPSVLAGSIGSVTFAGPAQDLLARSVDQLTEAMRSWWQAEEEQRQIHDPFPLPVRWRPAPEALTDHWSNIRRAPAGVESSPLALAGDLDQIVDVYRRIPSGRLIVLGREGSGKTILTLRFVLDLLKSRVGTGPVPVIFSLGSWNPTTTSLRDWLIGRLIRDHPGLAASGTDWSTLAAALVSAGRVLPVLDGFDEIATGQRRAALRALNATTLPLLLTSRVTEYTEAVAETGVLTSAAAIELTDLTLTDLDNYLPRTTRKGLEHSTVDSNSWAPVLAELRENPTDPASRDLAVVLTTPLMVALARTVYSDTPDRDPMALLDRTRFPAPEALEHHLLKTFVPTVYRYPEHQSGRRHSRWDVDRVHRWLGFLAEQVDRRGSPDLAWWQLGDTLRPSVRTPVIGVVSAFMFVLLNGVVNGSITWLWYGPAVTLADVLPVAMWQAVAIGLGFGLFSMLRLRSAGAALEPSRVQLTVFGRRRITPDRRIRKRFAISVLVACLIGPLAGLGVGLMDNVGYGLVFSVVFGIWLGLVVALTYALVTWLEVPIDVRSAVNPTSLLATGRRNAAFQVLVWGLVWGITTAFVTEAISLLGVTFTSGLVSTIDHGFVTGLVYGATAGVGLGMAYVIGLTAWGHWFAVTRIWLPLTGRLPWAVSAFLDDAYRRGVLRQSGAVYQFRHARLQAALR